MTSWTDTSDTITAEYNQLEPTLGFGQNPFGDADIRLAMHGRGFGDPITKWSAVSDPVTVWT